MNIQFEWPTGQLSVSLGRNRLQDNAVTFDLTAGAFDVHRAHAGHDTIMFYWHMTRLVMMNLCQYCVCRVDEVDIAYGTIYPLRESSRIQAAHFRMRVISDLQSEYNDLPANRVYPGENCGPGNTIHDIEDILPDAGHYFGDLPNVNNDNLTPDKEIDILKMLAVEYKRFLIWHEQDSRTVTDIQPQKTRILKTDAHFEYIRGKIKDNTLTECILDTPSLIEKALSELGMEEQWSELFAEEERNDLLYVLAPHNRLKRGRSNVSELVFRDFLKTGLDTHY